MDTARFSSRIFQDLSSTYQKGAAFIHIMPTFLAVRILEQKLLPTKANAHSGIDSKCAMNYARQK